MLPSERIILRVLAAEYAAPSHSPEGYGPFGRTGHRCGVMASRVHAVECRHVGAHWIGTNAVQAKRILAAL